MRHYEVVFMVHPDQSEQVPAMIERYSAVVTDDGGTVHRLEDWGRHQLAYSVNDVHKAHYVLMNIEATQPAMDELASLFKFNDSVLRELVIRTDKPITDVSPMMEQVNEEKTRERKAAENRAAREVAEKEAAARRAARAAEEAAAAEAEAEPGESATAESADGGQGEGAEVEVAVEVAAEAVVEQPAAAESAEPEQETAAAVPEADEKVDDEGSTDSGS